MSEGSVIVTEVRKIGPGVTDLISLESDDHYEINGGILLDTRLSWVSCGPRLTIIDNSEGCKRTGWTFSGIQRDAKTKVTCVVELPQKRGTSSLLIVGCESSLTGGTVCIYHTGTSRLLKVIHMTEKVTSLDVIHPGDDTISPLPDLLQLMSGVVAVGTRTGAVYFLDLCHSIITKCIESLRYLINDEMKPSQLLEVDLNDLPTVIEAKQAKCVSLGYTLSVLLNDDAVSDGKLFLLYDRSGRVNAKFPKDNIYVSAIKYFPQICTLGIGFNVSSFQLWNLIDFTLIYTSVLMEAMLPVSNFSFLEPCDDPRNVCYLWSFHQSSGLQESVPFAAMYMLNYDTKDFVPNYGNFYQGFCLCSLRYELDLGDDIPKAVDGRIISCQAISKTVSKTLPYLVDDQESNGEESAISLLMIAWEVWAPHRTSVTTRLSVFDLNQWYKEQMPMSPNGDSSAYLGHLGLFENNEEAVLDVRIRPETLKQFAALHHLDEHFYPSSLSFDCICLLNKSVIHCSRIGIQRACLTAIENGGPSALLNPERLFRQCVNAGLRPLLFDAYDLNSMSSKEQRDFVLSVVLENGMNGFLWDCVREWADGSQAVGGSTLPSLLYWAWSRVTLYKHTADSLCVPLFDFSGAKLDTNDRHILQHCIYQLHNLSKMLRLVLDKYRKFLLQGKLEQQCTALGLLSSYMDAVMWFVNAGLLPERSEDIRSQDNAHIPCYISKITSATISRRAELHHVAASLKHCPPPSGLYLIDAIISEEGGGSRLTDQWEREGGSTTLGMYPPPSVQSLLRIYLLSDVPIFIKHYIVVYFLMDLTSFLDSERYTEAIEIIERCGVAFGLTDSQTRVIKGFWNLDHKRFTEGMDFLLEDCVRNEDIENYQHRAILRLLLSEGMYKLSLRYINMKKPPLNEMSDISLQMTLLLVSSLIHEAFQFQRQHASFQTELLEQFFAGCVEMNRLDIVFKLPLNAVEEEAFMVFLEKSHLPSADELRVLYLLSRARYIEAVNTNDKLSALSCFRKRGGNAPLGLLTPLAPRGRNILGGQEDLSSGSPHKNSMTTLGLVINSVSKTIPSITKELAEHCIKQKASLSTWKQAERPKPLSVLIHTELNSAHLPSYKASSTVLMDAALSKTRETWASLLATPAAIKTKVKSSVEEMPFLRTPMSAVRSALLKKDVTTPLYETRAMHQAAESFHTPSKRPRLCNDDDISVDDDFSETPRKDSSGIEDLPILRTPYVSKKVQQKHASISSTPHSILKDRKRHGTPLSVSSTPSKKLEKEAEEIQPETPLNTRQIRFSMPSKSSPEVSSSERASPASPTITPRKPLHREDITEVVSERKRKRTPKVSSMARRSLRSELNRLSQEPSLADTAEEQMEFGDRTSTTTATTTTTTTTTTTNATRTTTAGIKRKATNEYDNRGLSSLLTRDKNRKYDDWWKTEETGTETEYFGSNKIYRKAQTVTSEKIESTVTEEKTSKYEIISGRRSYISESNISTKRNSLVKNHIEKFEEKDISVPNKLRILNINKEVCEEEKVEEEEEDEEKQEVGEDEEIELEEEKRRVEEKDEENKLEEEKEEEEEEEKDDVENELKEERGRVEEEGDIYKEVNVKNNIKDKADADVIERNNESKVEEEKVKNTEKEMKQTVETISPSERIKGEKQAEELRQKQLLKTINLLNRTIGGKENEEKEILNHSRHEKSLFMPNTSKRQEYLEKTVESDIYSCGQSREVEGNVSDDLYTKHEPNKEIQIAEGGSLQKNPIEGSVEIESNDDTNKCEVLQYSFGFAQSIKYNKDIQLQNFVKQITTQTEEDTEQSEGVAHESVFVGVRDTVCSDSEYLEENEVMHSTNTVENVADEEEVNDEYGGSVVEYTVETDENDIIYADLQPASIYDAENSDERKEILYGQDEQLEDNEDVEYYDGDLEYGEEGEIVEEEEEDEEEEVEEEEEYNEEEEYEEEEGLDGEAGEAEAENVHNEDNQNRSEGSDVICLDSDVEEANKDGSLPVNTSGIGLQKEQEREVCHGKVGPSGSVHYTNLDLSETLDYDEIEEEEEEVEEDNREIGLSEHVVEHGNESEIEKSLEDNEEYQSESEKASDESKQEDLQSDVDSPQKRNRSWQFEKNTSNIIAEELREEKGSEGVELSAQKAIGNAELGEMDTMKYTSYTLQNENYEDHEEKEIRSTVVPSKTESVSDVRNLIHTEEENPVEESEKEDIFSDQVEKQVEEDVIKNKSECAKEILAPVITDKQQSSKVRIEECDTGKLVEDMIVVEQRSAAEKHTADDKHVINDFVTSSVDSTSKEESYIEELECTGNINEREKYEYKQVSDVEENAERHADNIVTSNKKEFENISEGPHTKEALLVEQIVEASSKSECVKNTSIIESNVTSLKGILFGPEDGEKKIISEKVIIELTRSEMVVMEDSSDLKIEETDQKPQSFVSEKCAQIIKNTSKMDVNQENKTHSEINITENLQTVQSDSDGDTNKDLEGLDENKLGMQLTESKNLESGLVVASQEYVMVKEKSERTDEYDKKENKMQYVEEMDRREQNNEDMDVDNSTDRLSISFNEEDETKGNNDEIDEKCQEDVMDVEDYKGDDKKEKGEEKSKEQYPNVEDKKMVEDVKDKCLEEEVCIEEFQVIDKEDDSLVTLREIGICDTNALSVSDITAVSEAENQMQKQFDTGRILEVQKNRKTLRRSGSDLDINVGRTERKFRRRSSSISGTIHKSVTFENKSNLSDVASSGFSCSNTQTVQSAKDVTFKDGNNLSNVDVKYDQNTTSLEPNKVGELDNLTILVVYSGSSKSKRKASNRRRSTSVDYVESAGSEICTKRSYEADDVETNKIGIDGKIHQDAGVEMEANEVAEKEENREKISLTYPDNYNKKDKEDVKDKSIINRDKKDDMSVPENESDRCNINIVNIGKMQTRAGVESQAHRVKQFETGSIMDLQKNKQILKRSGSVSDVNVGTAESKFRRRSSSLSSKSEIHNYKPSTSEDKVSNYLSDMVSVCSSSQHVQSTEEIQVLGNKNFSEVDINHSQPELALETNLISKIEDKTDMEMSSGSMVRKTSHRRRSASLDHKESTGSEIYTEKMILKGNLKRGKSASSGDLIFKSDDKTTGDYEIRSSRKGISLPLSTKSGSESSISSQLSTDRSQRKSKKSRSRSRSSLLQYYQIHSKHHSKSIDFQPLEVVSSDEEQMEVAEETGSEEISKTEHNSEEFKDSVISEHTALNVTSDTDHNIKSSNDTVNPDLQSSKEFPDPKESKIDVNRSEINIVQSFNVDSGEGECTVGRKAEILSTHDVPGINENNIDNSITSRLRNRSVRASSEPRELNKESNLRSRRASSEEVEIRNKSLGKRRTSMRKSLLSYYLPSTSRLRKLRSDFKPLEVIESDEEEEKLPGKGEKEKLAEDRLKNDVLTEQVKNKIKSDGEKEEVKIVEDVAQESNHEDISKSNRTLIELEEIDKLGDKHVHRKKSKQKKLSEKLSEIDNSKVAMVEEKHSKKGRKQVRRKDLSDTEKKDLEHLKTDELTPETSDKMKLRESDSLEKEIYNQNKLGERSESGTTSGTILTSRKGQKKKGKDSRKLKTEKSGEGREQTEESTGGGISEEKHEHISNAEQEVGKPSEVGSEKSLKRGKSKNTKKEKKTVLKKEMQSDRKYSEDDEVSESGKMHSDNVSIASEHTVSEILEAKPGVFDSPAYNTRRGTSVASDVGSTDSKRGKLDLMARLGEIGDRSDDNVSTISGSSVSTRRRTVLLFDTPARRTRQSLSRASDAESVDSRASTAKSESGVPKQNRRRRSALPTTTQPDSSMIDEYTTNRRLTRHQLSLLSRSVDITPDVSPMAKNHDISRLEDVSEDSNVNEEDDSSSLKTNDSVVSSVKSQSRPTMKARKKSATSRKIE